jgi:hypothetical protein
MSEHRHCAECEEIVTQMRTAFLKLSSGRAPQRDLRRDDFAQFLSKLFASDENLERLSEMLDQSDFGKARHRWIEHRIATGHTLVLHSALN